MREESLELNFMILKKIEVLIIWINMGYIVS